MESERPVTEPAGAEGRAGRFGRYELLEEVGRGGMGVVWKARDTTLDRIVALKTIQRGALASAGAVERFLVEARLVARVHHAGVVGIYEAGTAHGQVFLALEFVEGGTLADRVAAGPLDEAEAARFVRDVARALESLHAAGVVHRDLKPSNVLVGADGETRLTDFGLAILGADGGLSTESGIAGTPGYMAPEQAAGRRADIGPRTDVYGAGAILYELLTAHRPFEGDDAISTVLRVLHAAPPRPRRWRPELSPALEAICLKCLEKDPRRRYASAARLAEDLERWLASEPPLALRSDARTRVARWVRREPALSAHLAGLAAFYAVELVNHFALGVVDAAFHRTSSVLVLVWAVLCFACRQYEQRSARAARGLWVLVDVGMLTLLLATAADGASSPLRVIYLLVIAAAGLWFDPRLVRAAFGLCALAFAALVADGAWRRPDTALAADHALIFAVALCVQALVVGHVVARLRALSRYYQLHHTRPARAVP